MEKLTLSQIAQALGSSCDSKTEIDTVCIDTRKIVPGCLFFAIKGENFDGHDFAAQALEKGAAAIVASREDIVGDNVIRVADTRKALMQLASYYRGLFNVFTVGITGSVGKTSTKEMIYAILSQRGKTLKTEGNFNNEIGMPLTMFNLSYEHKNGVFEMGMSDFGEISALTKVCRPNVGVITNIGVSHLETLGSRENILKAKMEITDSMAADAPLILNMDNDLLSQVSYTVDQPVLYFGIDSPADVTADNIRIEDGCTVCTIRYYGQEVEVTIPAVGRHNVYNALAGFCVGLVADMEVEDIVAGIRTYKNAAMRQNISQERGITIISDCYNASPDSMRAAIDVLMNTACTGKRWCVFGDMLELGSCSEESHIEIGREVGRSRADGLVCVGTLAQDIKRGAVMVGMKNVSHYVDPEQAALFLAKTLKPGDTVIYKASRGIHLEQVIARVSEEWKK